MYIDTAILWHIKQLYYLQIMLYYMFIWIFYGIYVNTWILFVYRCWPLHPGPGQAQMISSTRVQCQMLKLRVSTDKFLLKN